MKLVKFFAILFFDLIDDYFHKKRILSFLIKIKYPKVSHVTVVDDDRAKRAKRGRHKKPTSKQHSSSTVDYFITTLLSGDGWRLET